MLLGDLRRLFTGRRAARLPSAVIVEELGKLEERPWSEWRRGKPITARQLARQLESFSISPKKVRVGDQTLRGYELEQFEDAFSRYLPPDDPPHPEQINENAQLALEIDPPHGGGVADGKQQTSIDEPSNVPDVPWCDAVGEYHDTREERST